MARVVIYLREHEVSALQRLAEQEYRAPKAQAALIIRKELERLGMVSAEMADGSEQSASPASNTHTNSEEASHGSLS